MRNIERVTLRVVRKKKASLLKILKNLDYVEVETLDDKLNRFIKTAPKHIPLTEADIMKEVKAVRYGNGKK